MTQATSRPQLAYLTALLDDLRAKGTYFKLRVLDDQSGAGLPLRRPRRD